MEFAFVDQGEIIHRMNPWWFHVRNHGLMWMIHLIKSYGELSIGHLKFLLGKYSMDFLGIFGFFFSGWFYHLCNRFVKQV